MSLFVYTLQNFADVCISVASGMQGLLLQSGPFHESSPLLWQGSTANIIRNTLFFIGCFFIISSDSFKNMSIGSLCLSAVRTLVKFLLTATGLELMPGLVAVIQTLGDRINFISSWHLRPKGLLRLVFFSRNSWWQPRRKRNISEGLCGCFFLFEGRVYL